jgi:hypothetical protein
LRRQPFDLLLLLFLLLLVVLFRRLLMSVHWPDDSHVPLMELTGHHRTFDRSDSNTGSRRSFVLNSHDRIDFVHLTAA